MTYDITEAQRPIFDMGVQAAQHFRCNEYRDLYQDVFKAETADYKLSLGYDDVDGSYDLQVTFKRHWAGRRQASVAFDNLDDALARVGRFIEQRPVSRPRCLVDY